MTETPQEGHVNENGHVMGPNGHYLTPCDSGTCTPDDHPKLHYGDRTYHFDCLPPYVEQDVTRFADSHPQHAAVAATIQAARDGKHGDELRQHIATEHDKTTKPALTKFHKSLEAAR